MTRGILAFLVVTTIGCAIIAHFTPHVRAQEKCISLEEQIDVMAEIAENRKMNAKLFKWTGPDGSSALYGFETEQHPNKVYIFLFDADNCLKFHPSGYRGAIVNLTDKIIENMKSAVKVYDSTEGDPA